jgi:hypothetical protein
MDASRARPLALRLGGLAALVVVLLMVTGLFVKAVQKSREAALRTQCINNQKQLGLAVHNYASAYRNDLPALTSDMARPKGGAWNADLFVTLIPFLEAGDLFNFGALALPSCT